MPHALNKSYFIVVFTNSTCLPCRIDWPVSNSKIGYMHRLRPSCSARLTLFTVGVLRPYLGALNRLKFDRLRTQTSNHIVTNIVTKAVPNLERSLLDYHNLKTGVGRERDETVGSSFS